jgi:hypothetical protein
MAVRVRDLEIALVLAREMKAAAERSVDASLRLDQLQEVFGVEELDGAERARIQTALQMAGLEPFPSLLEAEPSAPIRFGASKAAAAAATAPTAATAEEPAATEAAPTFPTVGQFARSKLRSRRFGVRRGDHGEDDAPPVALPPPEAPIAEANGHLPDEAEIDELPEDEPLVDEQPVAEDPVAEDPVAEEPLAEEEYLDHEAPLEEEPHNELEPEPLDEREYIPLVPPQPVAYEEVPLEPEPQPAGARPEEVVAVLLPAVAIPVIVTSIAGWRFGLPFVALSVIATGWVLGRASQDGERRGFFATIRHSPAARTALKVTAVVTALSVAASVVLVAVRDSSSNGKKAAAPAKKTPPPPVASKPATAKPPSTSAKKKASKHHSHKATPAPTTPTTPAAPPSDPATQGLVRVPPSSSASRQTTTPSGSGTSTTP